MWRGRRGTKWPLLYSLRLRDGAEGPYFGFHLSASSRHKSSFTGFDAARCARGSRSKHLRGRPCLDFVPSVFICGRAPVWTPKSALWAHRPLIIGRGRIRAILSSSHEPLRTVSVRIRGLHQNAWAPLEQQRCNVEGQGRHESTNRDAGPSYIRKPPARARARATNR